MPSSIVGDSSRFADAFKLSSQDVLDDVALEDLLGKLPLQSGVLRRKLLQTLGVHERGRTKGVQFPLARPAQAPSSGSARTLPSWMVGAAKLDHSKTWVVGGPSGALSGSTPVRCRIDALNQVSKSVVEPA